MSEGKAKFTPGPWIVKRDEWGIAVICKESVSGMPFAETPICDIAQEEDTGGIQDAALIAAAPDMYAALSAVMQIPHFHFDCKDPACSHEDCEVTRMVVSALAKARGEAAYKAESDRRRS